MCIQCDEVSLQLDDNEADFICDRAKPQFFQLTEAQNPKVSCYRVLDEVYAASEYREARGFALDEMQPDQVVYRVLYLWDQVWVQAYDGTSHCLLFNRPELPEYRLLGLTLEEAQAVLDAELVKPLSESVKPGLWSQIKKTVRNVPFLRKKGPK